MNETVKNAVASLNASLKLEVEADAARLVLAIRDEKKAIRMREEDLVELRKELNAMEDLNPKAILGREVDTNNPVSKIVGEVIAGFQKDQQEGPAFRLVQAIACEEEAIKASKDRITEYLKSIAELEAKAYTEAEVTGA